MIWGEQSIEESGEHLCEIVLQTKIITTHVMRPKIVRQLMRAGEYVEESYMDGGES